MGLEEIKLEIQQILEKNGLSEHGNDMYAEYLGDVGIELNSNLYISHMKNFPEALEKLSKIDSPIADDGFSGIEIYEPPYTDTTEFLVDVLYLTDELKQKELFVKSLIAEGVKQSDIDTILNKCIKLNELGVDSITLVDCDYHRGWHEKEEVRLEKERMEDLEDHYSIDDYAVIPEEDAGYYRA